ncbi:MAG: hypothetical protein NT163_12955 [Chlorobiales bacterium]|nr:hypothetical protein [Chlorobiales bacterium]
MKITNFTSTQVSEKQVQIYFMEPIVEKIDAYELRLILEYFKKKKRVRFFYNLKPDVSIDGLICDARMWVEFLTAIRQKELAKGYYELMRDVPFMSVEDVVAYLKLLQDAELKEAIKLREKIPP